MADPHYRVAEEGALRVEPLGDLTAIFDRRSMQTHLVTQPMPEILAALVEGACPVAVLAARLADRFDLDGAGDATAILTERLEELAAMGLVERA